MAVLTRLFTAEIPEIDERWRPLFGLYMAGFAVVYAITFLASLHFVFLGPGLGDEFSIRYLLGLFADLAAWADRTGDRVWLYTVGALLVFSTGFRAWIVYRGYAEYRAGTGRELPLRDIVVFTLANLLNIAFLPLALLLLAGLAALSGFPPADGLHALAHIAAFANQLVMRVPTLVALPGWLALVCTVFAWTFVHYWMHRWSHTRRAMWLVLHRPHHMTPHLTYATVMPVVMSFPFALLMALPYLFVFSAIGKLFAPEPLYKELIVLHLVIYIGEIYGHSPALYERGIRNPLVRWLGFAYTQGVYHVLHHSSAVDAERKTNNNTVNIGPGPFCCWDMLFGTYQPLIDRVPPIGLHGNPDLHMNPLRLLVAGVAQLVYEIWKNPPRTWVKIVLGPSTYTPPVSRDFLLRNA